MLVAVSSARIRNIVAKLHCLRKMIHNFVFFTVFAALGLYRHNIWAQSDQSKCLPVFQQCFFPEVVFCFILSSGVFRPLVPECTGGSVPNKSQKTIPLWCAENLRQWPKFKKSDLPVFNFVGIGLLCTLELRRAELRRSETRCLNSREIQYTLEPTGTQSPYERVVGRSDHFNRNDCRHLSNCIKQDSTMASSAGYIVYYCGHLRIYFSSFAV